MTTNDISVCHFTSIFVLKYQHTYIWDIGFVDAPLKNRNTKASFFSPEPMQLHGTAQRDTRAFDYNLTLRMFRKK